MKKIILTIVLFMTLALSSIAANYVTVTGTNVRLRMGPSLSSETLTNANGVNIHPNKGERLECIGQSGDFYKVIYQGYTVYISKQYAKLQSVQQYVMVTGTNVRLRLAPSLNAGTLQRNGVNVHPRKGERIKLMGTSGNFWKVNYQGNYVYIHKDYAVLM